MYTLKWMRVQLTNLRGNRYCLYSEMLIQRPYDHTRANTVENLHFKDHHFCNVKVALQEKCLLLRGDSLSVMDYLSTSVIWPDNRGVLITEGLLQMS